MQASWALHGVRIYVGSPRHCIPTPSAPFLASPCNSEQRTLARCAPSLCTATMFKFACAHNPIIPCFIQTSLHLHWPSKNGPFVCLDLSTFCKHVQSMMCHPVLRPRFSLLLPASQRYSGPPSAMSKTMRESMQSSSLEPSRSYVLARILGNRGHYLFIRLGWLRIIL